MMPPILRDTDGEHPEIWRYADDLGYNVVKDPVHDLQATILNQMGIDHTKLTYQFQGRYYRLTDVHGEVVKAILT